MNADSQLQPRNTARCNYSRIPVGDDISPCFGLSGRLLDGKTRPATEAARFGMELAMILDWIYSTPTWLWGTVVVIALDAAACVGLVVFHRLVHLEVRRAHNELTGFTVAVISVTYAVLLAFIAIATWESFTSSEGIVDREADCVGSIYRDTQGLPAAMGQEIRSDTRQYTDTVIHQEWPVQQTGKIPDQGWEPLRRIHSAIVTMHPANPGEAVIEAELLKTLNMLYSARSSRISAVQGHIPEVIWWIIFYGRRADRGLHLFVRLSQFPDALGNHRGGFDLAGAGDRADHRARLAVPGQSERHSRCIRQDRAVMEQSFVRYTGPIRRARRRSGRRQPDPAVSAPAPLYDERTPH